MENSRTLCLRRKVPLPFLITLFYCKLAQQSNVSGLVRWKQVNAVELREERRWGRGEER